MELNHLIEFLQSTSRKADVKAVFGEPHSVDGRTLIPAARVVYGVVLGFGRRDFPAPTDTEGQATGPEGGGGGASAATPIAMVEVTDDETRVIPIVDSTKLGVAAVLVTAWSIFWIARTVRMVRRARELR